MSSLFNNPVFFFFFGETFNNPVDLKLVIRFLDYSDFQWIKKKKKSDHSFKIIFEYKPNLNLLPN